MLGKPVTDFSAASTGGTFRLKDERGSKLVHCFYPNQYKSFSQGPRHRAQHFRRRRRGVLANEWRGVKVPGHVQEVLNFVKAL
jgi:peroxiredoxin